MADLNLTVRAEELGDELRKLRENTGLSLEIAGEMINASATKMSRIENGLREGTPEDISALLAVYRCSGERRTELLTLAHEVERRGWWQRNKPGFPERQRTLTNLETKSHLIVYFETVNIHGLLQTREYAQSMMLESGIVPSGDIERKLAARMQRQEVLSKPKPPKLLALMGELVLHHMVGHPSVFRRQLDHLVTAAKQSNITLRIVPNTLSHASLTNAFELIGRAGGHKVVYLENLTSSLFLEEKEEIETYEEVTRILLTRALSPEESVELITERARELDPEAT